MRRNAKKYTKILDRLTWLNACLSSLRVATGISSVATLSTFISLPVSIPLGTVSLTGTSVGGVPLALTKKYQNKLIKVTKWVYIVTSALVVFGTSVSKALNNGKINEQEFGKLQTLYSKSLNESMGVDHKREAENRNQFENSLLGEIKDIKSTLKQQELCDLLMFPLCYFCVLLD